MVRVIPSYPLWPADFLERIRPGFALSAVLHAALLLGLAYLLAFHPALQIPPEPVQPPVITMVSLPPVQPKPPVKQTFTPYKTPEIPDINPTVGPLVIPPVENFDRPPAATTDGAPSTQDVIVDPKPIYRGGLVYPDRAADQGVPGYVDFSFVIEPDGSVGNPVVTAEVPDGYGFAAAAKKAFGKWRFEPRLVNGKPVAAAARIRVTFKMQ